MNFIYGCEIDLIFSSMRNLIYFSEGILTYFRILVTKANTICLIKRQTRGPVLWNAKSYRHINRTLIRRYQLHLYFCSFSFFLKLRTQIPSLIVDKLCTPLDRRCNSLTCLYSLFCSLSRYLLAFLTLAHIRRARAFAQDGVTFSCF